MIPRGTKEAGYLKRQRKRGKKRLVLLGSTGSIGCNAVKIVKRYPEQFEVLALGAGNNVKVLAEQLEQLKPKFVALKNQQAAAQLQKLVGNNCSAEILIGEEGMCQLAAIEEADLVLCSIVGFAGLRSTISALKAGNDVALANKESLVVAGELIDKLTRGQNDPCVVPVDSEHSAIFQSLPGCGQGQLKKIILTASGGPFFKFKESEFSKITAKMALNHPRWKMGPKVTIDSATMFNKGLELIEARWLFDVPVENIEIIIHPQSIVHSMIETVDGSIIAQLAETDMTGPIGHALAFPEKLGELLPSLNLTELQKLEFYAPDSRRFPALEIAREAVSRGGTAPCIMNAANEIAVEAFLAEKISYLQIAKVVKNILHKITIEKIKNVEQLYRLNGQARELTTKVVAEIS